MRIEMAEMYQSIPEFFKNQDVFITGATGFIGRVLAEKLLRSCPDIRTMFVLVRDKRSKSAIDRIKEFSECVLFSKLLAERPNVLEKIHLIHGDVKERGLGISNEDQVKLKDVSVIFHVAAIVRFDDPIQSAIFMNTRGTLEMLKLAETLPKLKSFVYTSTTYSNCDYQLIEERNYPAHVDWRKAIQIAESVDIETLNALGKYYTDFMPNTYVFTKALAEQVCHDYSAKLPITIYRPCIVLGIEKEPVPGWIANFYGPVGLTFGLSLGIMRIAWQKKEAKLFLTAADLCVNGLIVAAWKRGIEGRNQETKVPIYNCVAAPITTEEMYDDYTKSLVYVMPSTKTIMPPDAYITQSQMVYYIGFLILQLLPAAILDLGIRISGRKPFIVKIQRNIYAAQMALYYFMSHVWDIKNDNFLALNSYLRGSDQKEFDIDSEDAQSNVERVQRYKYNQFLFGRRHLLGESDDTIPSAKRWVKTLMFIFFVGKIVFVWIALRLVWNIVLRDSEIFVKFVDFMRS